MKALLTLTLLGLFSAALVGCHASADIDDDDAGATIRTTDNDGSYKKTTTIEPDGDRTTRTEVKVDR